MAAKVPSDFSDEIDSGVPPRSGGAADADLQLKKRARRRLVGAIALALFAIILLPLVMDREPPPSAPEIQVRIPSSESAGVVGKLASKSVPATVPASPVVPNAPAVAAVPVPVAPVAQAAAPAAVPEKPAEPKVASAKPPAASTPAATAAGKEAASAADSKVTPANKPETSAPKVEAAKEVPKEAAAGTNGKWEVQLGAYQSAGNVNLLLAKVKELRLPIYTEKFDSPQGPRTRVRSGPFPSKDAALAAQKRIRIIGVEGQVAPYSK